MTKVFPGCCVCWVGGFEHKEPGTHTDTAESDKAKLSKGLHTFRGCVGVPQPHPGKISLHRRLDTSCLVLYHPTECKTVTKPFLHFLPTAVKKLMSKPDSSTGHVPVTQTASFLKENPVSDAEWDFPEPTQSDAPRLSLV